MENRWPIEIDGLPINSMVDLSMAMLNNQMVLLIYNHTGWCPPVVSWFINPINYSYKYHKP